MNQQNLQCQLRSQDTSFYKSHYPSNFSPLCECGFKLLLKVYQISVFFIASNQTSHRFLLSTHFTLINILVRIPRYLSLSVVWLICAVYSVQCHESLSRKISEVWMINWVFVGHFVTSIDCKSKLKSIYALCTVAR